MHSLEKTSESLDSIILENRISSQKDHFNSNLSKFRDQYHGGCIFNRNLIVPDLSFWFDDDGSLHGLYICSNKHQGYDEMVHGGILAAIIDASMAQCLMGHTIIGYTAELKIKYKKPVLLDKQIRIKTCIHCVNLGILHTLKCKLYQDNAICVDAIGKFFKTNRKSDYITDEKQSIVT